jgi:hypothetical protein
MKGNIFMMAAVAVLAMACAKEQPASVNPSEGLAEIRVSVPDTKVAIAEQTGVCTWQDGDKIAIFFASAVDEENEPTAGVRIEFTYDGLYEDGSAKFVSASELPAEYVSAEAVYPASSMSEAGKNSLVRDYVYDADSVPVYLVGDVVTNADGTLASSLEYNASVMKFTLHDIPAYAAGFCLYSKRPDTLNEDGTVKTGTAVTIKTSFPYKTGYTADPADNANDIVLYSAIAHSSVPKYVYLVDGDGAEIEGSRKNFTGDATVGHDQFIVMPRIDFKKAELRKDYINIMGVKWAKGNLRYDSSVSVEGNQPGWHLAPEQWEYYGYDVMSSTVSGNDYVYNPDTVSEMRISRTSAKFDHFNFGGIGKWSYDINNYVKSVPATEAKEISGKIFSDQGATVEVTGDARFASEGTDAPALYGDLAFWATKGKYKVPSYDEMTSIHNQASKIPGWCVVDGIKVWGCLFRCPDLGYTRQTDATANQNREFTAADLETGMFLPYAGRTAETEDAIVINQRKQMAYRSAKYIKTNSSGAKYYCAYYSNTPSLKRYDAWDANGSNKNAAWSGAAGFSIRPVIAE